MENKSDAIRVLVVDDEERIRSGFKRILSKTGFHVLTAASGEEALEVLAKDKYSIVLLDLKNAGNRRNGGSQANPRNG